MSKLGNWISKGISNNSVSYSIYDAFGGQLFLSKSHNDDLQLKVTKEVSQLKKSSLM